MAPRVVTRKCTDQQIVDFIKKYHDENGWSPSVREIAKGVGLSSVASIHYRLSSLHKLGIIVYRGVRQIKVANGGEQVGA